MSTTQTITTSAEIPEILKPFYEGTEGKPGLIERGISAIYPGGLSGQAAYQAQYAPVIQAGLAGSGSVAGLSPFQTAVGQSVGQLQVPGQYQAGLESGQAAASGLQALQNFQATGLNAPNVFNASVAQQYMSPYVQSVLDRQQAAAIKSAQESQLGQNLATARQGTYGGARQALLQGSREASLQNTLADIQAKGMQAAYENAQSQFERDRAAQMSTAKANQDAEMAAAQRRLEASQGLTNLTGQLGNLGTQQLAGQLDVIKTQGAFGDLQRAIQQQQMDAQRQMLTDQAQYGQTQVGQLSNLLRGIPLQSSTQSTSTPPPSFASQLTGMGLTGLSLYNMLGGGGK